MNPQTRKSRVPLLNEEAFRSALEKFEEEEKATGIRRLCYRLRDYSFSLDLSAPILKPTLCGTLISMTVLFIGTPFVPTAYQQIFDGVCFGIGALWIWRRSERNVAFLRFLEEQLKSEDSTKKSE